MVLGQHAELPFGVPVVPLDDHGGGRDGDGNADAGRHDARHELPELAEYLRDEVHLHRSRSRPMEISGRAAVRARRSCLAQSGHKRTLKILDIARDPNADTWAALPIAVLKVA